MYKHPCGVTIVPGMFVKYTGLAMIYLVVETTNQIAYVRPVQDTEITYTLWLGYTGIEIVTVEKVPNWLRKYMISFIEYETVDNKFF